MSVIRSTAPQASLDRLFVDADALDSDGRTFAAARLLEMHEELLKDATTSVRELFGYIGDVERDTDAVSTVRSVR